MRIYNSFNEIDFELKRLNLERQIALEEVKRAGNKVQDDLNPYNWILPTLGIIKKFGVLFLIKKLFRK
ncbi:MAG: hypothetical protein KBH29_09765 [Lutibacter sp.]|nr:hypothetical protein [Lutibacter sp.]